MRALITCVGAYGHLHPLLPIARALERAGHDVIIATGPDIRPRAEALGFSTRLAGISIATAFEHLAEHYLDHEYDRLPPADILGWYVPHLFGEQLAPAMLNDLELIVRDWRPDVILHDTWEFAAPVAAASAGMPSISHTLGPRFADRTVEVTAAALAPLWQQRGLAPDPTAGLYRHLCLDIMPPSLQPYAVARPRDVIRPLRPVWPPPLPEEVLPQWIADRRDVPLIYMTLGTNTNSDISMFRSVIEGLGDLDLDVLITIGTGSDPTSLGTLPANVHVETYVSHALLLPYCSVVICHGGAGTVLNSLALGLPLLLLPQGADQYVISDLVYESGACLLLTPQATNPSIVRSSTLALLQEPAYKAAARRLQHEIAGMPAPDEAVSLVELIVARP